MTNYEKAKAKDRVNKSELNKSEHSSANQKMVDMLIRYITSSNDSTLIAIAEKLITDFNGEGFINRLAAVRKNTKAVTLADANFEC